LKDKKKYIARLFAVTDSSVVVQELHGSDERFGEASVPISIPIREVESVERLETDHDRTRLFVLAGALVVGLIVWLSTWDLPATD